MEGAVNLQNDSEIFTVKGRLSKNPESLTYEFSLMKANKTWA